MSIINKLNIALLALSFCSAAEAIDSELTCVVKGNMAMTTQIIRQTSGDDWAEFSTNVKKYYKHDEGLDNMLEIASMVYHIVPIVYTPAEVYDRLLLSCVTMMVAEQNEVDI